MLEALFNAPRAIKGVNTLALLKASAGFKELAHNLTVTKYRTPTISSISKFDNASFDCSAGWMGIGESSNFVFSKTDTFTIEWWQYITQFNGNNWFISDGGGATSDFKTYQGSLYLQTEGASWSSATTNILTLNTWQHIAIVQTGGVMRLYVNGVQKASFTATANFGLATTVFQFGGGNGYPAMGCMDQLRISNIARYVNAFTPPVSAFNVD